LPLGELRAISCTQCDAPLTLHGGHKVRSVVCAYCGSTLDTRNAYRVLGQFIGRDRPPTPIELGMTGVLKGVEFTVIALLQYQTPDGYAWLELGLFSPTHGYAWLEQVDNHFVFTRRSFDLPDGPVQARRKFVFEVRGRAFQVYESYFAAIGYVEGELTYVARAGEEVRIIEAIAPPYIYSIEETEDELEYLLGEYLPPAEVYSAFELPGVAAPPRSVHPAQPYLAPPGLSALSRSAGYFLPALFLAALLTTFFGHGSTVLQSHLPVAVPAAASAQSPVKLSAPFEVARPERLLTLDLFAVGTVRGASYDVQILREGRQVYSTAQAVSRGVMNRRWADGTAHLLAYFRVPEAGPYRVAVRPVLPAGSIRLPSGGLSVRVREGVVLGRYLWGLLAIVAAAFGARFLHAWRFEARRWE